MDELGGSLLSALWRVVRDLEELNREVDRLVVDLKRLEGETRTRPLADLATNLDVAAGDLRRSLNGPALKAEIGSYMMLIRRQSDAAADEMWRSATVLPSAQKLIDARYRALRQTLGALPDDLFLKQSASPSSPDLYEMAQKTIQVGTEIHQFRIRAHLARPKASLLVDGDTAGAQGWPDLSLIARRDALLTLLASLRDRAHIAVMFDWSIGGPEAVAPTDGIQVLLANPDAVLTNALLALVATQPADASVLLVSDDRELIASAGKLHGDLSGASILALLELLVEV